MRALVVTDRYPPDATGGYERSCADVVARWRRAGHAVTVLTTGAARDGGGDVGGDGDGASVLRELGHGRDGQVVAAAVRDLAPEVVSVWNAARIDTACVLHALSPGPPVVFVACDGWPAEAAIDHEAVPRMPAGSRTAWVSAALRDGRQWPAWLPLEGPVTGSGIDASLFRPRRLEPWRSGRRRRRNRLLYVGRVTEAKGVDDAVAALEFLPDDALLLVGADSRGHTAHLRRAARAAGTSGRLATGDRDGVERALLPAIYRECDVLLFPSRWAEPFGLVPLEAMACGTPVVATGTGGSASYLVDGGNCLLVPPRDPRALAAAVARLRIDPRLRRTLVRGGLATARGHTADRLAEVLLDVHASAAS